MAQNKTKFEGYVNKLYRENLKRFKEKQKKDNSFIIDSFFTQESKSTKNKRVALSSSQGKVVIDTHKKCVTCGKKYGDRDDFEIHHVNGDRSLTTTKNLVLLCHSCHKKVHTHASSKLSDYKKEHTCTSTIAQKSFGTSLVGPAFGISKKYK